MPPDFCIVGTACFVASIDLDGPIVLVPLGALAHDSLVSFPLKLCLC